MVILDEPSKLAAPDTSPPRVIVRAVARVLAVVALPVMDELIVPVTVRSPSTSPLPVTFKVPTLAVSTAAVSMLAVPSI
jgi:hypothetical protein